MTRASLKKHHLVVVVLSLLLAVNLACDDDAVTERGPVLDLVGTEFCLESIETPQETLVPESSCDYTLLLTSRGSLGDGVIAVNVRARVLCNVCTAVGSVGPGQSLNLGELLCTMMACGIDSLGGLYELTLYFADSYVAGRYRIEIPAIMDGERISVFLVPRR